MLWQRQTALFSTVLVTGAVANQIKRDDSTSYSTLIETWTTTDSAGSADVQTSTLTLAVLSDPWIPITIDSTSYSNPNLPASTSASASPSVVSTTTAPEVVSTSATVSGSNGSSTTASESTTGSTTVTTTPADSSSASTAQSSSTSAPSTAGAGDPTHGRKALTAAVAAAALGIAGILAF